MALVTTVLCLLIGYPFAYLVSRYRAAVKPYLIFLVIVPFWTNSLVRTYAMKLLIATNGLVNQALLGFGLDRRTPAHALHRRRGHCGTGVYTAAVHDPAAVCDLRTTAQRSAGGLRRSRRRALADVLSRGAAADHARHHRRFHVGVAAGGRHVLCRRRARRREESAHRQHRQEPVSGCTRLAVRRRREPAAHR